MDDLTFRQAMGKFATGITVITTELDDEVHGMTANAFMSVSLDPKLVLISIDKRAQMLEKIQQAKKYAISILAQDQKEYSMIFSGQIKEERDVDFKRMNDMPVLNDALLNLTCDVYNTHDAGDHVLFVGQVTGLDMQDGTPLLFYSGKYQTMSPESVEV